MNRISLTQLTPQPLALECGDWSTGHRFHRFGDSSPKQSRVQRLAGKIDRPLAFDGDESPAESAAKSAHSKAGAAAPAGRRSFSWVIDAVTAA